MRSFSSLRWWAIGAAGMLLGCEGGAPPDLTDTTLPELPEPYRAPPLTNVVDGVIWEAGHWEPHLPAGDEGVSWGNHRVVVELSAPPEAQTPDTAAGEEQAGVTAVDGADTPEGDDTDAAGAQAPPAVVVTIPWRRRDSDPSRKGLVVVDAASGQALPNVIPLRVDGTSGEVLFQPNPGSSTYHVYYMPWQSTGGYYPTVTYPTPSQLRAAAGELGALAGPAMVSPSRAQESRQTGFYWAGLVPDPDPSWLSTVRAVDPATLPRARTTHIQSVDSFHSFFPMEVTATPEETAGFLAGAPQGWRVVPEHRDRPVRMRHFIPHHWVRADTAPRIDGYAPGLSAFTSQVFPGEAFTFQLAVVSGPRPLDDLTVSFSGFPDSWLESLTCFNCGGIDETGEPFNQRISVPETAVQPLWIGVRIPDAQPAGSVNGIVMVQSSNRGAQEIEVSLAVREGRIQDGGADHPELQTRLEWLNSTLGTDPDFVIEPFEPVAVEDPGTDSVHTLSILGRQIVLGPLGLPSQILSYFTPELTSLASQPEAILARPMALEVTTPGDFTEEFASAPYAVRQEARGVASWTATGSSDYLDMTVEGTLEYDGMLSLEITLVALSDAAIDDIAFPVSLLPDAAEYMLGLGRKGGKRPPTVEWEWAVENHQEGVWLGAIHKGLQWVLRDENYARPLNTNFYRNQPLRMPPSWFNGGLGGILIVEEEGSSEGEGAPRAVTAYNYSGPRTLLEGDILHFNIRFLITPFKPIDTRTHFQTRFVHQYVPVDSVVAWGGTVVNIHHANEINPYINYPFYNLEAQRAYIDEAHEKGIKVKLYNTIRELTYKAHELFPLRSLGHEIFNEGEGGGHSWLQEHLQSDYHAGWHAWRVDDAAILNKGTSRWTNYYIEGVNWLAEHQHIDGLYLDDIAFSRETVKRLVTVLHRHRPQVVIDLHSANQFNVRDGFINSAMLYMEHFPFVNRLWFGEYFEYDLDEDYWMTEVAGLPFGLMGEMLQDGGHPYRGMLYGMTARKYGNVDPRPVWALMNQFGIAEAEMKGYWLADAPVTTNHPRVLATTYLRPEGVLIALASWSDQDEVVSLSLDPSVLGPGVDPTTPGLSGDPPTSFQALIPAVAGLQEAAEIDLSAVPIPANQGLFVVVTRGPAGG